MTVAKLSSNLLARKGRAVPSISRVGSVVPYGALKSVGKLPAGGKSGAKRVRKSLLLDVSVHARLRLLAARHGVSQQSLMEQGVQKLLDEAVQAEVCICQGVASED